jgi:2-polyprenyl-6-methoxyphenol hydroxylase-like FAD-dependent oxidoreductase
MATDGYEFLFRPGVAAGVIPTNDDQACIFVATTPERFRRDLVVDPVRGYRALLESHAPELSERLAAALPPTGLVRFPGRPGHVRRPWGPGWALVGDAGSWKDPITAHGLTDALRDAELLARSVLDGAVHGDLTAALARYESTRDRLSEELRTVTEAIASFRWDAAEVGALLLTLSASMVDEVDAIAALDEPVTVAAR